MTNLRSIMAVAAISLLVAAALHAGILIPGPLDTAAYYETGIAVILLVGLGLTFVAPSAGRWIGLVALAISFAGSCIGLFLAIRGLAPNTVPDIVYHVALVALLLMGLVVAWRTPQEAVPAG